MTDLNDQKLQRILDLSESNNRILQSIRRSIIWGRVFHFLYWVIIIAISIGALYYLKPYFNQLSQLYSGFKSGASSVQGTNTDSFGSLLKNLGQ